MVTISNTNRVNIGYENVDSLVVTHLEREREARSQVTSRAG